MCALASSILSLYHIGYMGRIHRDGSFIFVVISTSLLKKEKRKEKNKSDRWRRRWNRRYENNQEVVLESVKKKQESTNKVKQERSKIKHKMESVVKWFGKWKREKLVKKIKKNGELREWWRHR